MSRMGTVAIVIDTLLMFTPAEEIVEIAEGNVSPAMSADLQRECDSEQLPFDAVRALLIQDCQERVKTFA